MSSRATSREALESVRDDLPRRRRTILTIIRSRPASGATCAEIASRLRLPMHAVSGRLTELSAAGAIAATGDRRKNPASGRSCIVWRAA